MEKIDVLVSTLVPVAADHIDTDQIIPARFLKATDKKGFGEALFADWRKNADGSLNMDCVLNNPLYKGSIMVAGKNFGCGSSREHAAWALFQAGFRVIIAPSFADIFKQNALNNGIVPVELGEEDTKAILSSVMKDPSMKAELNLQIQMLSIPALNVAYAFDIPLHNKNCILNGYDDFDFLCSLKEETETFEKNYHA